MAELQCNPDDVAFSQEEKLGEKHDGEKPNWSLLPFSPMSEVVSVLTYGARKYQPDNWRHVEDADNRYFSAAMRHIAAWKIGHKKDPETGCSHLAHAVCCLLFMMWFESGGRRND